MMKLKYLFTMLVAAFFFTGCSDDNDPAGPLGNIVLSDTYVIIPATGGTVKVDVKATQDWKITNVAIDEKTGELVLAKDCEPIRDKNGKATPTWFNVSQLTGTAGDTELSFTADAIDGGREIELQIEVGDGTYQFLMLRQGSLEAVSATCAEVIAGADGKNFRVKGVCTAIAQTTYGNWYLSDETGEIYIYGTLDKDGKTQNFSSLGIEVGDVVEVEGPKTTYGSVVELVDVTVISIKKTLLKIVSPEVSFDSQGGELEVKVAYKGNGVYFTIPEDCRSWVTYKDSEYVPGVPTKIERNPADTAVFKFDVLANMSDTRNTSITFKSSKGSDETVLDYSFTQKGSIIKGSIADFNFQDDGTEYKISGVITNIVNTVYGNMYIQDATGEAYIYGTLTADGQAKQFESLGLNVGDVVVLNGPKGSYKGSPQMVNGVYQSHITVPGGVTPISIADFRNVEDSSTDYYLLTGVVGKVTEDGAKDDIAKFGNFNITDLTGSVYVYGVLTELGGDKGQFGNLGVKYGDTITILATKSTYKGLIEAVGVYVSHTSAE